MSKFFRKANRTVTRSWKHQTRSVHQWAKFKRFVADMPQDMLEFELEDLGCLDENGYEDAYSIHLNYLMDSDNWENLDSYHDWVCMRECLENEELVAKLEHQYGIITHYHDLQYEYYKIKSWSCEDWSHTVEVDHHWVDYHFNDAYKNLPGWQQYEMPDEWYDQVERDYLEGQYYWTPEGWKRGGDYAQDEAGYWQEIWNKIQPAILKASRKEELRLLKFEILWNKAQAEVAQILDPQENEWLKKSHSQNSRLRKTIGSRAAKYI